MALRRIKIVCDGLARHATLVDADTGEDLKLPMTSITWRASAKYVGEPLCVVEVELQAVAIDAVARVTRLTTEIIDFEKGMVTTETRRL